MIISTILYSKKLVDINKRYSIDSPRRVDAERVYGPASVMATEVYVRGQARWYYERNRAIESVAYIGILALLFWAL